MERDTFVRHRVIEIRRGKAMRLQATISINRTPEDVWTFIADPRNDPQWCDKVESVEQVSGQAPGSGARYEVLHRPVRFRKPKTLSVSIEEWNPPHRLRMREEDDDAVFDVTYRRAPEGDGTNLTQIDEIDWKVPFPGPQIGRRMVQRDIERQFAALRRVLEGGARS